MDLYISPANRQLKYRSDYTYFSEIFRLREIYFFVWAAEGAPRAGAATAPRRRQSVARRFCDPGGVGTRDPDPTKAAASSPGDLRPASSTLIRDLGYYSRLADDTFASGGSSGRRDAWHSAPPLPPPRGPASRAHCRQRTRRNPALLSP